MSSAIPENKNGAEPLFEPFHSGVLDLSHRLVYAPLTRCRAPEKIPLDIHVTYYTQRTTPGGLLISEGTNISERAAGYPCVPGIWTQEQVAGWRPVTAAVHEHGGTFFCQLWHVGRASAPCYQPNHELPVGPSAIAPVTKVQVFDIDSGKAADYGVPRALDISEIPGIVEEFRAAARNAIDAGFDGVEIHGANGYIINQFLDSASNQRTDAYGGPIENRVRFALEIVAAVVAEVGAERTAIRLSPFNDFLGMTYDHPYALYTYLLEELNAYNLAYVHLVEPRVSGFEVKDTIDSIEPFRKVWKGTIISAGGFTRKNSISAVASGHTDLVAVGRLFLSNPDLPKRWALDAPLNKYDRDTFYTQGVEGYLDYPFLEQTEEGKAYAGKE